ncbi:glycoside hydrolase family 32 protein [Providencia burhodogranariea]|uniref:Sucrose-6-phosphate hydrolase n=1 Tax=Providencia burhodogranariea DSM 19968 TaxID=1141662 RepID=K8WWI3_9GAMM|nr:glycoside hydrolase family 32 protein [Providencia burhodogranariea]EKT64943.1 sucrose-6-phosphate hydrolase [Providencia burhodogranariea DSM 19968]
MKQRIDLASTALETARKSLNKQFYPEYHLATYAGWLNDPNGLIYHEGLYHAFYQHHPFSSDWGPMHWGHATSKDMVNWQHQPIALAPGDEYDRDGCFSGSAISHEGKLYLFYTGHIWLDGEGNDSQIYQSQCLAISEDGIHFEKKGVIIPSPEGYMHFRDPKVWYQDARWWMVVGARDSLDQGQILLFSSDELLHWSDEYQVLAKTDDKNVYMWECPDFFPLGEQFVTLFSPQGKKPQGHQYRNRFQNGYLVGNWSPNQPYEITNQFTEIDFGHDFYAPQTFLAEDDRRIAIAWMDMWESNMPSKVDGWAGCFTLPRELTLNDQGKVLVNPIRELTSLRQEAIEIKPSVLAKNQTIVLHSDASACEIELIWDLQQSPAEKFGLAIGNGAEFFIDGQTQQLTLSRHYPEHVISDYRCTALPQTRHLKIRAFIDKSSLEVFINDGELCFTSRIYPQEGERALTLFAINQSAKLLKGTMWQLNKSVE